MCGGGGGGGGAAHVTHSDQFCLDPNKEVCTCRLGFNFCNTYILCRVQGMQIQGLPMPARLQGRVLDFSWWVAVHDRGGGGGGRGVSFT